MKRRSGLHVISADTCRGPRIARKFAAGLPTSFAIPGPPTRLYRRLPMRIRSLAAQVAAVTLMAASQLRAQRAIDLTSDMLDRFLKGTDAENVEMGKSGDQLKTLDDNI